MLREHIRDQLIRLRDFLIGKFLQLSINEVSVLYEFYKEMDQGHDHTGVDEELKVVGKLVGE